MTRSFARGLCLVAFALGGFGIAACPTHAEGQTGTFAVVSDIHFDPFDPPTLAKTLAATDTEDWASRFAGLAGQPLSDFGKDTNHALLASSLTAIAAAAAKTDFAIVGGDLLAHDFQENAGAALDVPAASKTVDAFAERTTIFVGDALRQALPGKPIIVALGNNDSDCGDYRIEPGGPYLIATRELVRDLAGAGRVATDFDETYASGGYYAVRHPTVPGTLILVLNDILWSADYENACGSTGLAAADAMMAWLRDRLAEQKAAGGHVWMVHHIPWGIDPYSTLHSKETACPAKVVSFLREPYASQRIDLLREFRGVVVANFSGHVHYDDYRLLADEGSAAIALDKVDPGISPIFGQNPGFEIFEYDVRSGVPTDFSTFYLANLDKAPTAANADWRLEYTFTKAYAEPRYSVDTFAAVAKEIAEGGPAADTFRTLYPVSRGKLRADILPAYSCAMRYLDRPSFTACFCGG